MPVLVNFKICDNADVCSGVAVCPTRAIYWDAENKTLQTDNSKCTCCGKCAEACPAGAIAVANNESEFQQLKKDIDADPRTIKDLMVERYGASPIEESILISVSEAISEIKTNKILLAIEVVNELDTACLIDSVPIAELFDCAEYRHRKITSNDSNYGQFSKMYGISKIPALILFIAGKPILKVDGMVHNRNLDERESLIGTIKEVISR